MTSLVPRRQLCLVSTVALVLAMGCAPPRPVDDGGAIVSPFDSGEVLADAGIDAGNAPDAGAPDAGPQSDAGPAPQLAVSRVLPPRGAAGGGTAVLLEGQAFLKGFASTGSEAKTQTSIRFGSNPVIDFQILDDETIELRTPPGVTGSVSVSVKNPNGAAFCTSCFAYFTELVLTGLSPRAGPLAGGTEVTLSGEGFTPDTQVLFGAVASPRVTYVSPTQLQVISPRGVLAESVDVIAYNQNGVSTQRRSFKYAAALAVAQLTPMTGPPSGGTVVRITGAGLSGVSSVHFGPLEGSELVVADDSALTVKAPPGAAVGAVDVVAASSTSTYVIRNGFSYVEPSAGFAVFALVPHVVVPGQTATLTGQALDVGAIEVAIGGEPATIGARTPSTMELVIPPRGQAPRTSDVVVTGPSTSTLVKAATWRLSLTSVSPASGPSTGGTQVELSGSALPEKAIVSVDTLSGSSVEVLKESALRFITPACSGGARSDVWVREEGDAENEAVLSKAFDCLEALSVGRVSPPRGSIAGGTLVTVLGSGFGESTVVSFGPSRAKDIKIVDSHTLTCRTPKSIVGVVDVAVERSGARRVLVGGYSYVDPRSISGGLSGGPLLGTLNVTVLDSTQGFYGAPVSLASVVLGLDATTPFQGLTDVRGQITFSDASLVKAQTVTVFKEGYQGATVAQVSAENLTVFLSRVAGDDGDPGPPPPGPAPSSISGRVTGFKSPRPLATGEALEARVFVAQPSLYSGPPFRLHDRSHETWQVKAESGEYLVFTGAGVRAVYAILGILNAEGGGFEAVSMGVKRGISTSADSPATGVDIVIDTQMDVTIPITIDGPLSFPSQQGQVPGLNAVYAWLDLGAEGFVAHPQNWAAGTTIVSSVASTSATLSFPRFPRIDGSNFIFLNKSIGLGDLPASYAFRRAAGDLSQGVTLGPMLPTPHITAPADGGFSGTVAWTADVGPVPDLHHVQVLLPTLFGPVVLWEMVLPGTDTQVVLPQAAVEGLRREAGGFSLFVSIFSSRSSKFAYNQWTYDTLSGASWSSFTQVVSGSFVP